MAREKNTGRPDPLGDTDQSGDPAASRIPMGRGDRVDQREHLRVRVAWYYYVEGLTQAELAEQVGISRSIVNRILAQCRDTGVIQVRVNSPLAPCVALEAALTREFGLRKALVVPTPAYERNLPHILGAQAGEYLSDMADELNSLGVGWGRTLWNTLKHVRRMRHPGLSIVSLLGGLHRTSAVSAYETATRLAEILGAECYYLAAPVYAGSEESRRVLREQDFIREVMHRAQECDMALVSAGDLTGQATMRRLGLVSDRDAHELTEAGAVGDVLGHYLDDRGSLVDHPLNQRVIAFDPRGLRELPQAVLVSGGQRRIPIIRAALRAGYANVLITDEQSAKALIPAERRPAED
ncbi:MAG TPA: sugar-binding transcriptional regulator [Gammaproteobacteria bacterium]|nr:sugar-binding transcriptional regulator [Gammaproteobacteria bacterium]